MVIGNIIDVPVDVNYTWYATGSSSAQAKQGTIFKREFELLYLILSNYFTILSLITFASVQDEYDFQRYDCLKDSSIREEGGLQGKTLPGLSYLSKEAV
jgi:hypothetical protein